MLKKLALQGFKSFAGKTEFVFEPGLTAIVGPNGCGKSNVVDAIKWVLGEQSAKSLRGGEMLDLIFAGSSARDPVGYAEACLTFDNRNRRLPVDSDEVVVTRRLYRSGESEYLLGGETCRLRDVRELFLDTGIGLDAYSVIEQGRVDQLLQANPVQRRAIFEEAAGISKYKARRQSAERKLQRVEQNLLRLNDIIEEVERQLRSIKYQAAKARKYREYAERLREVRLAQAARNFTTFQARRTELRGRIEKHSRTTLSLVTGLRQLEAGQSEAETALLELEQTLNRRRATSVEFRTRASRAEQSITLTENRIEELDHEQTRLATQLERLSRTVAALEHEHEQARGRFAGLAERLQTVRAELLRAEQERDVLASRRRDLEQTIQQERNRLFELTQEITRRDNDRRSLQMERTALVRDRDRLQERRRQLRRELEQIGEDEKQLRDQGSRAQTKVQQLSDERTSLNRRLGQCREHRHRLQQELELARREEASKRGRHRVLADLETNLEGLDQAVRKVLEENRTSGNGRRVHGIVAQLIRVPAEHSPAVDAALGPAAQAVVTSTLADALALRSTLADDGGGRVQFLPLERDVPPGPMLRWDAPAGGRVLGRLRDLVSVDDNYAPLVDRLLGDVLLVEDVHAGLELQLELTSPLRLVTRSGELIEPDGRLVLGSGQAGAGLVSRRSQIDSLEVELAELATTIARKQVECETADRELQELEAARQAFAEKLTSAQEELRRYRLAGEQLAAGRRQLNQEDAVLESEIEDIESQLSALKEREEALAGVACGLTEEHHALEGSVRSRAAELKAAQEEDERVGGAVTELKITLAQVQEQHASLELSLANLKKTLAERHEEQNFTRTQAEICQQRRETARDEVEQAKRTLQETQDELERVQDELTDLEARRAERRHQLTQDNERARKLRAELDAEEDELQKLELADSELRLKQENLCERIAEEYQVPLAERYEEFLREERDWEAVTEEVEFLRQKISRLGNVNLDAIEEEEELSQRAQFLHEQRDDLLKSKADLERVITRINRRCRELFLKTFQAVRTEFQVLFRKLFGGGRADVFLADESDVLESGIEIMARPPGKELKTISLLSGGEKSLTAAAILFAIFRTKPSPFCLLDEVDAAMDEANVERFLTVLREFLNESQFIVITHCKRTMAESDVIYGVTMQEPGVSTRVAVRLEEAEALVA